LVGEAQVCPDFRVHKLQHSKKWLSNFKETRDRVC